MSILKEFMDFLNEYKVIGLAVAFIIGAASTALIKSLVDNIIMPVIGALLPGGAWREAKLSVGPVSLGVGPFLGEAVNFVIIAAVVFIIAKKVLKQEKVGKI